MTDRSCTGALPRFSARAVLIDMDGTVNVEPEHGDYFVRILRELVAGRQELGDVQAEGVIRERFDPAGEPITEAHLNALGIDFDAYWNSLIDWQQRNLEVYGDAVTMIRLLHDMGVRMYPASTNSSLACRAKLARAGLTGSRGPGYFTELFGGSDVCPGGKAGPEFFRAVLARIGCDAREVVMVGDDVKADLQYARGAGIEHVVIVRRDQRSPWTRQTGAIFVKSLTIVPSMLAGPWDKPNDD